MLCCSEQERSTQSTGATSNAIQDIEVSTMLPSYLTTTIKMTASKYGMPSSIIHMFYADDTAVKDDQELQNFAKDLQMVSLRTAALPWDTTFLLAL